MKLVMQTIPISQKCRLCEKTDTKLKRRKAEVERINRWQAEGSKFHASISKSMDLIKGLDSDVQDLTAERQKRLCSLG